MNFRNLFLTVFLAFAVGFALVHAEESKEPRGPKITSKVGYIIYLFSVVCQGNDN